MGGKTNPLLRLAGFRGYADDAVEGSATPLAAVNTDFAVDWEAATGGDFRLRFLLQEYAGATYVDSVTAKFQCSFNGGAFNDLSGLFATANNSPYITSGADTTQQIGSGTFYSDNNGFCESSLGTVINIDGNTEVEVECAIRLGVDPFVSATDSFQFRLLIDGASPDDTTITLPTVTLNAQFSGVKTVRGVDEANIKSKNGILNAVIKTINGVPMP